jgi:hypothetical protein
VRSLEVADRPDVDVSHQDPLRAFEPSRTAWIAFAAGASGLALSAVFDVITNTEYDSLAASCSPMCGQAQTAAGRAEQVVTDVALAVGVAGIVVGASLWAARIVTGSRPRSTAFVGVGSVGVHF